MTLKYGRRTGAILAIVLVLSLLLVPAVAASSTIYVVQRGDSLSGIGARFGLSAYTIAAANGITNLNRIYVGQRLVIPTGGTAPATGGVHVVRAGETLTSIARYYGIDVYVLARANDIYNLNRIYPGQRLVIPGSGTSYPPGTPTYYTVQRGDYLSAIAARFGTTTWQLMQWNNLSNANFIYPGQVLRVSGGGTVPAPPPQPVPVPTAVPVGSWTGTYYNSQDLTGSPVLSRQDANIDFNWGFGSPASQVFADRFSARWTRTFNMSGGTYRVSARVDDGVRVYIDGVLVIDSWIVQAVTTYTRDVVIPAGNHTYTVEYFEAEGQAEIHITSQKL